MQGQTPEETQVVTVPLGMDGFRFQSDDGFVRLDVDWKRDHAYTSYRMIDDVVDEKGDIRYEFAHPESGLLLMAHCKTSVSRMRSRKSSKSLLLVMRLGVSR